MQKSLSLKFEEELNLLGRQGQLILKAMIAVSDDDNTGT